MPTPSTLAMILAGLSIIGSATRVRKQFRAKLLYLHLLPNTDTSDARVQRSIYYDLEQGVSTSLRCRAGVCWLCCRPVTIVPKPCPLSRAPIESEVSERGKTIWHLCTLEMQH